MTEMKLTRSYNIDITKLCLGVAIGDAMGVPFEFNSHTQIKNYNPSKTKLEGNGTYLQPAGTWSDDTSLTLALVDALSEDFTYTLLFEKMINWVRHKHYINSKEVFDIGGCTQESLRRALDLDDVTKAGGTSFYDNGNGALMRIAPLACINEEVFRGVCSITHAHNLSMFCCELWIAILRYVGRWKNLIIPEGVKQIYINKAVEYCFSEVIQRYNQEEIHRSINLDMINSYLYGYKKESQRFNTRPPSSGFVVHTLIAALWCINNAESYEEAIWNAVMLGEDTDTTAAVAGALASIIWEIPQELINQIGSVEIIIELCEKFDKKFIEYE